MIPAIRQSSIAVFLMTVIAVISLLSTAVDAQITKRIVEVPLTGTSPPELSPGEAAKIALSGTWEVSYSDRELGFVEGEATIYEDKKQAKVIFYHPRTGREFILNSSSFSRNGGKLVIEFEGRQPGSRHEDGQAYPDRALVVDEKAREVSVSVGTEKKKFKINRRKPSDIDAVRVELDVLSQRHMKGRWLYRADPAIKRDQAGYGRVGEFTIDEEGNGQQSGGEVWTRPRTVIYGAVTIQDQTLRIEGVPGNPYPFKPKHMRRGLRHRTLLVFGKNLPEDPDEGRAVLKSFSEKINYGGIYYLSQASHLPQVDIDYRKGVEKVWKSLEKHLDDETGDSMVDSAQYISGEAKKESAAHSRILQQLPPKARQILKDVDFLIITAYLKPDVLPGYHAFELNGATQAWQLAFGDNWAEVSFVRENSRYQPMSIECYPPRSIGQREDRQKRLSEDRHMEVTKDLFIREKIHVEVNTNIKLDLEEIPVFVSVGGNIWKFGNSPYLQARRVPGKPCTYRTEPIWLTPVYKPADSPVSSDNLTVSEISRRKKAVDDHLKSLGLSNTIRNAEAEKLIRNGWSIEQVTAIAAWQNKVPHVRVTKVTGLSREEIAGVLDSYHLTKADSDTATRNRVAGEYLGKDIRVPSSKVVVAHRDALSATIAMPGLFSLRTPVATARVRLGPGVSQILPGWKQALMNAAECRGLTGFSLDELTVQDPASFLERYKNLTNYGIFVDDWGAFLTKYFTLSGLFLNADKDTAHVELFNTEVMLGDLAAMMLLRTTFVQLMFDVDAEFARFNEDWELLAFRHYVEPLIWIRDYGIGEVEIKDKDGSSISFMATFGDNGLEKVDIEELKKGKVKLSAKQRWALDMTRKAIARYREVMTESRQYAETINPCDDIKDLIELTGRSFNAVEARVRPRMMQLSSMPTAGGPVWTPDYVARGHLDRVGAVYNALKLNEVRASQDDSSTILGGLLVATAIVSIPVIEAGGIAAIIAQVLFEADLAYIVYNEMDRAWQSQKEISFAEGAVDVLGHERLEQARKNEYGYLSALTASSFYVALDKLVMAQAARGGFALAHAGWQKGTRFLRMKRAERFFRKSLEDVGRNKDIFATLNELELKKLARGLGEYLEQAKYLQRTGKVLDNTQLDALSAFEKSEFAQWNLTGKKPAWAARVDAEAFEMLKPLKGHANIHVLMNDAAETVNKALMAGGRKQDEALSILIHTPQRTAADFDRALKNRLKEIRGHKGARLMDQAAATDARSVQKLKDENWKFKKSKESDDENSIRLSVIAPNGKKASIVRAFDPATKTFFLVEAFRREVPAWINVGLDVPLVASKGVPTIQFMTLRIMHYFKLGFRGTGQVPLKAVEMKHIANARTILQVKWLRDKYFPGKTLRQLANDPEFGKLLAETRSIRYARSVIEKAGYQIDGPVVLSFEKGWYKPSNVKSVMSGFKQGSDGETAAQFARRFGYEEDEVVDQLFTMKFKVKPAAADDTISTSTRSQRPPGTETLRLPRSATGRASPGDTEPMVRRPTGSNDGSGGSPPPGDRPTASPGEGGDPPYMRILVRLRQQSEQQAQHAQARYGAHQRGEIKLTPDELDEIFWTIHSRDTMQAGLEKAVSEARRHGVPDSFIGQHVSNYTNSYFSERRMIKAVRAIERSHLQKQGFRVLGTGDTEAEMMSRLITNSTTGNVSREELSYLRKRLAAARGQGRDYFDDLARTGNMTAAEPFELLADADDILRLRALAKSKNLYSSSPRSRANARSPPKVGRDSKSSPETVSRSRAETQTMRRPDRNSSTQVFPLEMPPTAKDAMRKRLSKMKLDPLQMQHVLRTVSLMQKLGVPEEFAREMVALNAIRLANPGTHSLNQVIQTQLVAEGIIKHGTRRVTMKEVGQAVGVSGTLVEIAVEAAARRGGYAPLPGEILPGRMYPP